MSRQFARMIDRRRCLVFAARLFGSHKASCEFTWFRSGRDRRLTLVGGSEQRRIIAGCLHLLRLRCDRSHMLLFGVGLLLRRRARFYSASTTVVAHVTFRSSAQRSAVCAVNDRGVYATHRSVVHKTIPFPATAFISKSAVTVTIINPAVVAHGRSPISILKII